MDKAAFCQQFERKLSEHEKFLRFHADVSPSTLAKNLQHERNRPVIAELRESIRVTRAQLDALCASTGASWEGMRDELDQRWMQLDALMKQIALPTP